jgi:hypothetical protein
MDSLAALTPELIDFIEAQQVFFVATAPLARQGHVNCSPKGLQETLRVLDADHLAYLDLTGSGAETIAHVRENGRITLMLCSFDERPRIVRVYGTAQALLPGSGGFEALRPHLPAHPGVRAIVSVAIARVTTSCGYGVPVAAELRPRGRLSSWLIAKGEDGLARYRERHNRRSIDGLPGLT